MGIGKIEDPKYIIFLFVLTKVGSSSLSNSCGANFIGYLVKKQTWK